MVRTKYCKTTRQITCELKPENIYKLKLRRTEEQQNSDDNINKTISEHNEKDQLKRVKNLKKCEEIEPKKELKELTIGELLPLRGEPPELDLITCSKFKSLKIFFSFTDVKLYTADLYAQNLENCEHYALQTDPQDDLVLDPHRFNHECCRLLGRLFPNVERLIVYIGDRFEQQPTNSSGKHIYIVPELLRQWPQLKALSLFGNFALRRPNLNRTRYYADAPSHEIWRSIIELTNLKWLDLVITALRWNPTIRKCGPRYMPYGGVLHPEKYNRLLSRLERFFIGETSPEPFQRILPRLGPNCRQLFLDRMVLQEDYEIWSSVLSNQHLLDNVTDLRLSQNIREFLPHLYKFVKLKSLELVLLEGENVDLVDLNSPQSDEDYVLPVLAKLHNLVKLKLVNFSFQFTCYQKLKNLHEFPVLKSIAKLAINPKFCQDNIPCPNVKLFFNVLAHCFPNVEGMILKSSFTFTNWESESENLFRSNYLENFPRLSIFRHCCYRHIGATQHDLLNEQHYKLYQRELAKTNGTIFLASKLDMRFDGFQIWRKATFRYGGKRFFDWTSDGAEMVPQREPSLQLDYSLVQPNEFVKLNLPLASSIENYSDEEEFENTTTNILKNKNLLHNIFIVFTQSID